MCCMSVHTSNIIPLQLLKTTQSKQEKVEAEQRRGKKRREGDQAVVKLRVECLPSSRDTISLGGRHSDTKNWDPPDGRKRSSRDKGI